MVTIATRIQMPSILLVRSERHRDWAFEEMLKTDGFEIYSASSGEAALAEYEARQPDLLLVDVWLPGIDGIETWRRLRNQHGDGCAPVVFMNGGADVTEEATDFPAGVVDFLPEPFVSKEALVHIRAHLAGRRMAIRQQAMIAELRGIVATKDKLLSMCAHDLLGPLSSVCGLAEFLLDPSIGSLNARQTELVDSMREASQNLLKLVNQLFDVSVVEAGKLRLELAPASLRDFAKRAVFLAAVTAVRKGINIVLQPSTSAEPLLMIDATRVREVVDNLLSNAVKYSPPGSCISVAIEALPAGPESGPPCVRFSVRDQGPGVPVAERDLLFRDFSRLSACPTGGEKSTGLGLAICRKIIDLHGGSIGAVNHPEGGCVFSFILPVSPCN
jgi:signal transduction histidine kinase